MSFSIHCRVYWEDTDAGGIVYYANYLKYMERARSDWLRAADIRQADLKNEGSGMFVVTEVALKYHAPARLDDWLRVTVTCQEAGSASMTLGQEVWRANTDQQAAPQLLVTGRVRAAWVNPTTLKPAKIPTMLKTRLMGLPAQQP